MTKVGNDDKRLKDAIALGEKNKNLIPRVKNWCNHMEINNVSAGMIAEVYNLPISLQISCPHASDGFEAMNFEWIAGDFILANCRSCEFHQEVHKDNFGKDVINDYLKRQEEIEF